MVATGFGISSSERAKAVAVIVALVANAVAINAVVLRRRTITRRIRRKRRAMRVVTVV